MALFSVLSHVSFDRTNFAPEPINHPPIIILITDVFQEAYCSYEVGPSACARCISSGDTTVDEGLGLVETWIFESGSTDTLTMSMQGVMVDCPNACLTTVITDDAYQQFWRTTRSGAVSCKKTLVPFIRTILVWLWKRV